MSEPTKQRDTAIDLIKTFAILGVLLIHASSGAFDGNATGSFPWNSALFWGTVSRASVPLFFMCTGALFLRPEKDYPLKKLLTKTLPRILAALFIWALLYKFYSIMVAGPLTLDQLIRAVKEVLLFRHEGHLYYLHIVLLVYLCVPILRILTVHADQKQLGYILIIWFCTGILYPTVKGFWPFTLVHGIPEQYALNMTWASMGYCLLGYCLRKYPIRQKWVFPTLWGIGLAATFFLTLWYSLRTGWLQSTFLEGMSVNVAVMGMGIFGTLSMLKPGELLARVVKAVSDASFTIYLSHMLFLREFTRLLGWNASAGAPWAVIPAVALSGFLCSFVLWLILRRIPGVRRVLT